MRIRKTSETTQTNSQVTNTLNSSIYDTYSCNYMENRFGGTLLFGSGPSSTHQVNENSSYTMNDNLSNYAYILINWVGNGESTTGCYSSDLFWVPITGSEVVYDLISVQQRSTNPVRMGITISFSSRNGKSFSVLYNRSQHGTNASVNNQNLISTIYGFKNIK